MVSICALKKHACINPKHPANHQTETAEGTCNVGECPELTDGPIFSLLKATRLSYNFPFTVLLAPSSSQ